MEQHVFNEDLKYLIGGYEWDGDDDDSNDNEYLMHHPDNGVDPEGYESDAADDDNNDNEH